MKESARKDREAHPSNLDIISSTISQTTFIEDRQLAVYSQPSNTDVSRKSMDDDADISRSSTSDGSETIKRSSLRSTSIESLQSDSSKSKKKTRKKARGSKLERSYTPDLPDDRLPRNKLKKNQLSYSWNPVPLPPKLSDGENRVQRSFSNDSLASRRSHR